VGPPRTLNTATNIHANSSLRIGAAQEESPFLANPQEGTTMPLNEKQQAFIREYAIDKNASAAARRAGYSPRTAGVQGHKLLKNPKIQAAIQQHLSQQAEQAAMSAQEVLQALAREAIGEGPDTSSNARIAALKALGDYHGLWSAQKHEVKLEKHPRDMTDEELLEALHAYGPN